jgi:beta-glucanase (GH16 family)
MRRRDGDPRGSGARTRPAALALALALGCGLMPPEEAPAGAPETPMEPVETPPGQALPPSGYALVWEDDFEGTRLDPSSWTALAGRRRDAVSTPDAVAVSGGVLTISTYTDGDGIHRTGFINTEGKLEARYGYFEARIRFNDAPGSWCAFWLTAPTVGKPLGDPGAAGVEIDVVEHRVTDQSGWDALRDMVAVNLNWDGYDANKKNVQRVLPLPDGSPVQGFWHTYAVLWTPDGYVFYVDGLRLWSTAAALSHRAENLHLTCEVDDASWAGYVPAAGYGARGASVARMDVDWVRVWQPPP